MATMIPQLDLSAIENKGEQLFYEAASRLPDKYTVLYSYKYHLPGEGDYLEQVREADFIIAYPSLGFVTIEVKEGNITFANGQWSRELELSSEPLRKNPVEQARAAMFAVLDRYKAATGGTPFPLQCRYAVCFPTCTSISGTLPADLLKESVILQSDLPDLEDKIRRLFKQNEPNTQAFNTLINQVLSPSFKVFNRLEEQIEIFNTNLARVLSDEQERILDETELNPRMIFFGAAGTGKTYLALEKARRLAAEGKKVLLTCFNKNLAAYLNGQLPENVIITNFHDFLLRTLNEAGHKLKVPENPAEWDTFFSATLPTLAFDHFMSLPETDKCDALLVDEGQDFREEWFHCLESVLTQTGEFYIFADPHQSVFNRETGFLKTFPVSRHRLTRNLRNSEEINKWLSPFLPENSLKSHHKGGLPVSSFPWMTKVEERRLIGRELGRLVNQGIQPKRVVILSPHTKESSCLVNQTHLRDWPLGDFNDTRPNAVRFATIRSFKGLEADIVFLIGLRPSQACRAADVYVGASRARFLLYVFHQEGVDPRQL